MDDDEFDLPNAEEYFAAVDTEPGTTSSSELLNGPDQNFDGTEQITVAADRCLGLPELLERMILFVPPLQVYRLQLVSTFWRDLISRSIPIRRHMYFAPEKFFVRTDLNTLFSPVHLRTSSISRLASALLPFRCSLYAHMEEIGVDISFDEYWERENRRESPERLFRGIMSPKEGSESWRRILINDSMTPLKVNLCMDEFYGPWPGPEESSSQLTGRVTLGDVIAEAKDLAEDAWRYRKANRRQLREYPRSPGGLSWDSSDTDSDEEFGIDYDELMEAATERMNRMLESTNGL